MQAGPDHPCARHAPIDGPPPSHRPSGHLRRAISGLLLVLALVVGGAVPSLAAHPTQAQRVAHAVESHIGARYVHGATGPRTFDCSGLVFRSFKEAGLARRIGGFDTAHGYFSRFRRQGRLSRVAPRVGDLVVYSNGGHVGIYVGRGTVVSALLSGVKRHPIRGLNIPFTGILRVSLTRGSTVVPTSTKRTVHRRVVVAQRKLPVRANPGSGSSSLGTIKRGTRLVVYGTRKRHATTWLRVRMSGGQRGWVNQGMTSPA